MRRLAIRRGLALAGTVMVAAMLSAMPGSYECRKCGKWLRPDPQLWCFDVPGRPRVQPHLRHSNG
jgi:hypothetical protein